MKFVTPEKAGVQKTRLKRINALLDAGLRRHDEIMATAAIFNKLLMGVPGCSAMTA